MTRSELTAIGRLLYGPQWQTPLGAVLGVSDRTVRRWVAGDYAIPDGVVLDIVSLARAAAAATRAANKTLAQSHMSPVVAMLRPGPVSRQKHGKARESTESGEPEQ